ncbi:hypothetical protein HO133_003012 [Letharia lupina]|uniref:AB hydrolase-1 domain-containing protein n=1 Tax=Letharia lupina TaxID=560253 RepID=A0A8H6FAF9_9LECA|nr:uncharacterized protein HO133_003012 [Letharia lupina]KAF6220579.1 hypothetical protein HO133_003012 [Letharia lupina]
MPTTSAERVFHAIPVPATAESLYNRSYFYVGGEYVDAESGDGQRIFTGQMYVEQLTPAGGVKHPWPIVFIQGGGQTGTNFLNTPDGRKGWASWLLDQGYTVYLLDQISRGRSSYHPSTGPTITYTAELAEKRWTACRDFQLWPEAALHTQWPGSGRVGDPVFDAYYASTVPSLRDYSVEQTLMQTAGASLLDRIGPAVLATHSQGGTHGWLWADVRPELVKAIVAIEPSGPPFQSTIVKDATVKLYGITDIPMSYDPPADATIDGQAPLQTHEQPALNGRTCILQQEPARRLKNLSKIPVLLETGEASSHASYDEFTVRFLRQAGVNVKHLKLADEGVHGNGHLQFLEKNNLEIIEMLEKWIKTIE